MKSIKTSVTKTLKVPKDASKSVTFKGRPSSSTKKKFIKTPHSSKSQNVGESNDIKIKKRKLSFSDSPVGDSSDPSPAKKSRRESKNNFNPALTNVSPKTPQKKSKVVAVKSTTKNVPNVGSKMLPKKKKSEEVTPEEQKRRLKLKTENTIFVGNIPVSKTIGDIIKLFSPFGKVENARFRCITLAPEAKTRREGAILKKYAGQPLSAYVKFRKASSTLEAASLNGTLLDGHHLRVDVLEEKGSSDTKKAIFLRSLPFDLTEDELWAAFEGCGQIESVRIVKDVHTYKSRGLGYVNFKSASSVELALKMDNSEIKNRPIRVHRCGSVQSAQGKSGKKPKKKFRKREQATGQQSDSVFSGKQAVTLKKKKNKRPSGVELKKKKIMKVLTS